MEDYNKKLELARDWYNDPTTTQKEKVLLEGLFPELKESENEKIRKNCIHFLELQKSHHAATFEIEECIAWLEKQGEQKPWREEDEQAIEDAETWLDTLCDYLKDSSPEFIPTVKEVISKLKSLKDRVQPKQEWSEEDEKVLEDVRDNFEFNKGEMTDELISQYDKWFEKIKSLRPQSQ